MAWRGTARFAVVVAAFAWPIGTACSGGSAGPPAGSGNDFTNDTRDSSVRATPNPDPPEDAGADAMNTGPAYGDGGAVYPGVAECGDCTCGADKYYCFGGATARAALTPLGKDAGSGSDGGLPACVVIDASTPQLGCNPQPAGCATSANPCACIINELQKSYSCTLQCVSDGVGKPMTAYCKNY